MEAAPVISLDGVGDVGILCVPDHAKEASMGSALQVEINRGERVIQKAKTYQKTVPSGGRNGLRGRDDSQESPVLNNYRILHHRWGNSGKGARASLV
jgi:hypothetical protein